MQRLKTAQSVTDAKPDLGHTDKLPSSIAFSDKESGEVVEVAFIDFLQACYEV